MRVLQAGRDELQTQSLQQTMTISDLQSRNSQIAIENETLKRRIVDLQQVVVSSSQPSVSSSLIICHLSLASYFLLLTPANHYQYL